MWAVRYRGPNYFAEWEVGVQDSVGMSEAATRITVVTRPDCHLCEEAKVVLRWIGEPWAEINVEDVPALEAEYGDRVPVILLDGKEHDYWRVDEQRLRRDLH